MIVIKRNGAAVAFQKESIYKAVRKSGLNELESSKISDVVEARLKNMSNNDHEVEKIQDLVEKILMEYGHYEIAKSYILYREEKSKLRKRDLFKPRINFKPYEYPELVAYQEAIQHSYWLFSEFNYTGDIQDFSVNVTDIEKSALENAMLAISQVEVAVKNFWGELHLRMPKPEVGAVGAVFAESEVRHSDSYSHLLEILGLNDKFDKIQEIPALKERVFYLTRAGKLSKSESDRDFTLSLILFSLFIENVSLFSQFLTIMSFNKYKNLFKGMSNVQEASSKEEKLHGEFGIELVNILRVEHPEWFDQSMVNDVYNACIEAYESEERVIEWIFEKGELDFMPMASVKEYVKDRLNQSLTAIGFDAVYEIDQELLEPTYFMDDELNNTKHVDFFVKRSINYTKKSKSVTADDLF